MQDIRASSHLENNLEHPIAPLLYTLSTMHCMSVSLAQGGAGLSTMWGEEMVVDMLHLAGFERVEVKQPEHDFQNNFLYYAQRLSVFLPLAGIDTLHCFFSVNDRPFNSVHSFPLQGGRPGWGHNDAGIDLITLDY